MLDLLSRTHMWTNTSHVFKCEPNCHVMISLLAEQQDKAEIWKYPAFRSPLVLGPIRDGKPKVLEFKGMIAVGFPDKVYSVLPLKSCSKQNSLESHRKALCVSRPLSMIRIRLSPVR